MRLFCRFYMCFPSHRNKSGSYPNIWLDTSCRKKVSPFAPRFHYSWLWRQLSTLETWSLVLHHWLFLRLTKLLNKKGERYFKRIWRSEVPWVLAPRKIKWRDQLLYSNSIDTFQKQTKINLLWAKEVRIQVRVNLIRFTTRWLLNLLKPWLSLYRQNLKLSHNWFNQSQ